MILVAATEDWRSPPVRTASRFQDRLQGLRRHPGEEGLLLWTRSVHSFGMKEAVWVVDVAEDGRALRTRLLLRRRVLLRRPPGLILELPAGWPPPPLNVPLRPFADAPG